MNKAGHLKFTRRDFMKFSTAGMLGLFLKDNGLLMDKKQAVIRQGRSTVSGAEVYETPAFGSKVISLLGRDQVMEISAVREGEFGPLNPYNNTWYEVGEKGFAYSGWIQPVETEYQRPVFNIPAKGQLGEITIPFTDARQSPDTWARKGYRVYYSTTHWVTGVSVNRFEKSMWYQIYDFYLRNSFYIRTTDMRLISDEELSPLSPAIDEVRKYIVVDTGTQSVAAFEDDRPVLIARCSTGTEGTRTPPGNYLTFHKGSTVHMASDAKAGSGYDLPGVAWVSFFTGTGIAFHATYWHNNYGRPLSRGCVNLSPADARFIYRWTRPVVPPEIQYLYKPGEGTRVEVI